MHRPKPQAPERSPAVPADRLGERQLVLRADRGIGREPGPVALDRPPVHQAAVLRNAEGPGTLRHQSEEGSAAHASARPRGRLSEAIDQPPGPWPQGLPVFTAEYGDYEARPDLGERHHLHAVAARLPLPDGRYGSLQPQCAVVAALQHAEGDFCLEALDAALVKARSKIFNTDQGAQFTASAFTSRLEKSGVAISMDGRGRALDNVFVERLWRTVKYEEGYPRDYVDGWQAEKSLGKHFDFYRDERPHQVLGAARRRRSTPRADTTKTFALKSPLRRTQNEGTSNGTQPVNRLVAAPDPW